MLDLVLFVMSGGHAFSKWNFICMTTSFATLNWTHFSLESSLIGIVLMVGYK